MSISDIGRTLEVSASAPATEDQAGYEALTFTEVLGIGTMGGFGKSHESVTYQLLKTGKTKKGYGAYDNGSFTVEYLTVGDYAADAGQAILKAATDGKLYVSCKVTDSAGNVEYFQALVLGDPRGDASTSSSAVRTSQIEIDSDIVYVAA